MPGQNNWAFKLAAENKRPYHNSMDGTRVIRTIELYENEYLVGGILFTRFSSVSNQQRASKGRITQANSRLCTVSEKKSSICLSFDLVDTTGKISEILTGTDCMLLMIIYSMMLSVEQKAAKHNLSLVGYCTDSTSNSLNALLKLATPSQHLVDHGVD